MPYAEDGKCGDACVGYGDGCTQDGDCCPPNVCSPDGLGGQLCAPLPG
ncbi:Ion channel inhibitory toxin [Nannocystis exedens]|uniref:Ion channel inhibitory toxin n=1 Tax=Nannocystis exedens TaxID=54 RepID=A0A1I2IYK7_9BACT|nr:hypothetical protein [Nannocystis exedens]PCC68812.1 Spider potassium channel inhibitory toxin [Nannocystis exedens]SFF46820.1 Ion channel inhibitory toxin [Nannocystis exedens]